MTHAVKEKLDAARADRAAAERYRRPETRSS
jgi:hypothetical protein